MAAGVMTVEYHLPENASLKGKRQLLQSLKAGLRNKFNVSVAETGYHDLWQRAELQIAVAGADRVMIEKEFEKIYDFAEAREGMDLINSSVDFF